MASSWERPLSTVQGADRIVVMGVDRIVVMGDGRIEEIGTHEELLRKRGAYTALHRGQLT
ncbi:hypothetical protein A4E84_38335 [Streptomyces qaidamensis]|uniref:ABC transporter ATP-binding protein n=1 Tax=Streptomyces qaidamensis TaxID=1783515 RepID=A0A143CBJ7_9ACTN|nr:hypothetical protein [Streptomyces qaidamensis]AMW14816.1 hypothetical protein A4E84_38335 [Streptomyces qaidamensis]